MLTLHRAMKWGLLQTLDWEREVAAMLQKSQDYPSQAVRDPCPAWSNWDNPFQSVLAFASKAEVKTWSNS